MNRGKNVPGAALTHPDDESRHPAQQPVESGWEAYRMIFEHNPQPMWVYDLESLAFLAVNEAAVIAYGYSLDEFLSMTIRDIRPPEDIPELLDQVANVPPSFSRVASRHRTREGEILDVEISSHPIPFMGQSARLVVVTDLTGRVRAEKALRESERRYRLLFERNLAGVYRNTLGGAFLDCNDACARMLGYETREELLADAKPASFFNPTRSHLIDRLREERALSGIEVELRTKDGKRVWALEAVTLVDGVDGGAEVMEGTLIDVTDWHLAQERINYQTLHDEMTGLPNRQLFSDRLARAVAVAEKEDGAVAVMVLGLNGYELVQDTLGFGAADHLIKVLSERLSARLGQEDTLARFGSDVFALLVEELASPDEARRIAQAMTDTFSEPVTLIGEEVTIGCSIGIALYDDDGLDGDALLKNADNTMRRARKKQMNGYHFSSSEMAARSAERLSLEMKLRRAVERHELLLHYQPLFDSESGAVVGMEALVRWLHPERGLLQPVTFISIAEESGLIVPLGEWVMREACRQARIWQLRFPRCPKLSINLSPLQFQQPSLVELLIAILRDEGLDSACVELEVTESLAMENVEETIQTMHRFRDIGVTLAIDDFGTGYSSLSYLRRFPVQSVKIDRSFVSEIGDESDSDIIVKAMIALAHSLNLGVVAEGVETKAQLDFLRRHQCETVQGYLFSRPLPASEMEALLDTAMSGVGSGGDLLSN